MLFASSVLGPVYRLVLLLDYVVQVGMSPRYHREPPDPTYMKLSSLSKLHWWISKWLLLPLLDNKDSFEQPSKDVYSEIVKTV